MAIYLLTAQQISEQLASFITTKYHLHLFNYNIMQQLKNKDSIHFMDTETKDWGVCVQFLSR